MSLVIKKYLSKAKKKETLTNIQLSTHLGRRQETVWICEQKNLPERKFISHKKHRKLWQPSSFSVVSLLSANIKWVIRSTCLKSTHIRIEINALVKYKYKPQSNGFKFV